LKTEEKIKDPMTREASHRRYHRALFNNKNIMGIYQSTPFGRFISANAAFANMLGYSNSKELITNIRDISEQLYVSSHQRHSFRKILENHDAARNLEFEAYRKDGGTIWLSVNVEVVRDENDKVLFYQGFVYDISARKKLEYELREHRRAAELANERKSAFLATMSHEFRTPLSAIIGYAELISYGLVPVEKLREYARSIEKSGEYLKELIDDLLDISKIESGKFVVEQIYFSLKSEISEIFNALRSLAELKGIGFNVIFNDSLPEYITADPKRFKQILNNVIGNAIKFTNGGSVSITMGFQKSQNFATANSSIAATS